MQSASISRCHKGHTHSITLHSKASVSQTGHRRHASGGRCTCATPATYKIQTPFVPQGCKLPQQRCTLLSVRHQHPGTGADPAGSEPASQTLTVTYVCRNSEPTMRHFAEQPQAHMAPQVAAPSHLAGPDPCCHALTTYTTLPDPVPGPGIC